MNYVQNSVAQRNSGNFSKSKLTIVFIFIHRRKLWFNGHFLGKPELVAYGLEFVIKSFQFKDAQKRRAVNFPFVQPFNTAQVLSHTFCRSYWPPDCIVKIDLKSSTTNIIDGAHTGCLIVLNVFYRVSLSTIFQVLTVCEFFTKMLEKSKYLAKRLETDVEKHVEIEIIVHFVMQFSNILKSYYKIAHSIKIAFAALS